MLARLPLAVLLAAPLGAQQVRSELLVSTTWLAGHLSDPKVVVLHVGRDRSAYDAGHISGARFLAWSEFTTTRDGIPNELPPVPQLVALFERLGVSDDSRVVLYGESFGPIAARAWFTLDYLGHGEKAALLDGGLEKWRAEQRPLSKEEPPAKPGRFTARPRPEIVVGLDRMRELSRAAAPGSGVLLLDSRSPAEYSGAKPAGDPPRAGHIPGAVNLYWVDGLISRENPVLRPPAELRRLFEAVGAAPGRKVVSYCNSGVQASLAYFMASYLGYDAALYDGSIAEWNRSDSAPLATRQGRH